MNIIEERKKYTEKPYSKDLTITLLENLYTFLMSKEVKNLQWFCDYDRASLLCAIEHLKGNENKSYEYQIRDFKWSEIKRNFKVNAFKKDNRGKR